VLCLEKGSGILLLCFGVEKPEKKLGLVEGGRWVQMEEGSWSILKLLRPVTGELKLFPLLLPPVLLGRNRCIWERSGCLQKAVY